MLLFLQTRERHCHLQGIAIKHPLKGLDDLSGTSGQARVSFEALS